MPSSIPYNHGDVVLVAFRFTDQVGYKRRPAVILSTDAYHAGRRDAILMALTTQPAAHFGDCQLTDWHAAGLPRPTNVKAIVQTFERSAIERRLGRLTTRDLAAVCDALRTIFGL